MLDIVRGQRLQALATAQKYLCADETKNSLLPLPPRLLLVSFVETGELRSRFVVLKRDICPQRVVHIRKFFFFSFPVTKLAKVAFEKKNLALRSCSPNLAKTAD